MLAMVLLQQELLRQQIAIDDQPGERFFGDLVTEGGPVIMRALVVEKLLAEAWIQTLLRREEHHTRTGHVEGIEREKLDEW